MASVQTLGTEAVSKRWRKGCSERAFGRAPGVADVAAAVRLRPARLLPRLLAVPVAGMRSAHHKGSRRGATSRCSSIGGGRCRRWWWRRIATSTSDIAVVILASVGDRCSEGFAQVHHSSRCGRRCALVVRQHFDEICREDALGRAAHASSPPFLSRVAQGDYVTRLDRKLVGPGRVVLIERNCPRGGWRCSVAGRNVGAHAVPEWRRAEARREPANLAIELSLPPASGFAFMRHLDYVSGEETYLSTFGAREVEGRLHEQRHMVALFSARDERREEWADRWGVERMRRT